MRVWLVIEGEGRSWAEIKTINFQDWANINDRIEIICCFQNILTKIFIFKLRKTLFNIWMYKNKFKTRKIKDFSVSLTVVRFSTREKTDFKLCLAEKKLKTFELSSHFILLCVTIFPPSRPPSPRLTIFILNK